MEMYKKQYSIEDLRNIMRILRGDQGCPWDKKQNHHSIRKNFLEETYEVLEAIDQESAPLLCEELGDVLLQIVFHTQLEEEQGHFDFEDVVTGICKKLIHRHPHVFSDASADSAEQVLKNWENIKRVEKNQQTYTETLEQVPKVLPALMRSEKVQHRASRAGVESPDVSHAVDDLLQHVSQLQTAVNDQEPVPIDHSIGNVLFSCVRIARFFNLNCEKSLTNTVQTFINRFRELEQMASEQQIDLSCADRDVLEALWQKTK